MTTTRAVSIPTGIVSPRWVRYMFLGSVAGFLVALVISFIVGLFADPVDGQSVGSCVATACAMTLLLSQPIALGGLLTGAVIGATTSGVVHLICGSDS